MGSNQAARNKGTTIMKIELKSIKHFPSMSQDSEAFNATIYVDGKKVGTVMDNGWGGQMEYSFISNEIAIVVGDHIKSLDPIVYEHNGEKIILNMTTDLFFGEILAQHLKKKDAEKQAKWEQKEKASNIAKGFPVTIFVSTKHQMLSVGLKTIETAEQTFQKMVAKHNLKNATYKVI